MSNKVRVNAEYLKSAFNNPELSLKEIAEECTSQGGEGAKKVSLSMLKQMYLALGLSVRKRPRGKAEFEIVSDSGTVVATQADVPVQTETEKKAPVRRTSATAQIDQEQTVAEASAPVGGGFFD